MTPEQKLAAAFAHDAAPARDLVFMAVVAQRIARRRAILSVLACIPWAVAAAVVLWALRPLVETLGRGVGALEPAMGVLGLGAVAVGLVFWGVRRLTPG
ncbi:MAG: hypothetical protein ACREEY_04260 [Brevundimonas sp.]